MSYAVVINFDKSTKMCTCAGVSDDFKSVLGGTNVPLSNLGNFVVQGNLKPLNFSIDKDGSVTMDCGDFSRFSKLGSAVVLQELVTKKGKILGYTLLACKNAAIANLKLDEILKREEAYGKDEHFIQNGIIRNDAVCCYPRKPFNQVIVNLGGDKKKAKSSDNVKSTKKSKSVNAKEFTPEQIKELKLCEKNGVSSKFIYNPELKPKQMRILWMAKKDGCPAEVFSNPKIPVDVMKVYANMIFDKTLADECSTLFVHPELDADQARELILCVYDGVDCSSLVDKNYMDIRTKRYELSGRYWMDLNKVLRSGDLDDLLMSETEFLQKV